MTWFLRSSFMLVAVWVLALPAQEASAQNAAQCKQLYDGIFERLNAKGPRETRPKVTDAEIAWALQYEIRMRDDGGCPRFPYDKVKAQGGNVAQSTPTVPATGQAAGLSQSRGALVAQGVKDWNSGKFAEAAAWFESACSMGSADGCFNAAQALQKSRPGLPQDLIKTRSFYEKSCEYKLGEGCEKFGLMSERGNGGPRNEKAAHDAFQKACRLNEPESCSRAGAIFVNSAGPNSASGWAKALPLFQSGCKLESGSSCYNIGSLYHKGRGGYAVDFAKARKHFQLACELGLVGSCNNWAAMILSGEGGPKNAGKAIEILTSTCEKKNAMACNNLSAQYANPFGGMPDIKKSVEYARLACEYDQKYCKQ